MAMTTGNLDESHYKCRKVVQQRDVYAKRLQGAYDALTESAKQFRLMGAMGHASVCNRHASLIRRTLDNHTPENVLD